MKKYVYENATVYITIPTEEQLQNIRLATERFVQRLAKEGLIFNEYKRESDRRTGVSDSNARKGNKKVTTKD